MKRYADIFLRALMTGFAIGIGGAVYLPAIINIWEHSFSERAFS